MPVFDNLKNIFWLAKFVTADPDIQLTYDEYIKYLNVWNQLDDDTQELYTRYAKNNVDIFKHGQAKTESIYAFS